MIARPLARLSANLYASPRYLEISGEPKQPSDLTRHQRLCMMKAKNWTLHQGTQTTEVDIGGRFRPNSVG
jgi:hypothetical protein